MSHELKVILGDTAASTTILIDNQPIGLIQDIKFHASVDSPVPTLEIVFPNLMPFKDTNESTVKTLEAQIEWLREIPNVTVTLQTIKF